MSRISDKNVVVRKERKCFGCLKLIKRGDLASIQTNAEDGKIYSLILCEDCERYVLRNLDYDDEFFEGELKGLSDGL